MRYLSTRGEYVPDDFDSLTPTWVIVAPQSIWAAPDTQKRALELTDQGYRVVMLSGQSPQRAYGMEIAEFEVHHLADWKGAGLLIDILGTRKRQSKITSG